MTPGVGGLGPIRRDMPVPGPGQVLLEITAAGVCGTDLELDPLISAVAPMSDWQDVFARTRRGEGIKYLFEPRWDTEETAR